MSKVTKESWYCPSCKNEGNTGRFCGTCGKAKPDTAPNIVGKVFMLILHILSTVVSLMGSVPLLFYGVAGVFVALMSDMLDDLSIARVILYFIFGAVMLAAGIFALIFGITNFMKRKEISPKRYTSKEILTTGIYFVTVVLMFVFTLVDKALASELSSRRDPDMSMVSFVYVVIVISIIFLIPTIILLIRDAKNKPQQ